MRKNCCFSLEMSVHDEKVTILKCFMPPPEKRFRVVCILSCQMILFTT